VFTGGHVVTLLREAQHELEWTGRKLEAINGKVKEKWESFPITILTS
jgi:hypothetical protein